MMRTLVLCLAAALIALTGVLLGSYGMQALVTGQPFSPRVITSDSPLPLVDGSWELSTPKDPSRLADLSYHLETESDTDTATLRLTRWRSKTGWFIFLQNPSSVWTYDGERELVLYTVVVEEGHLVVTCSSPHFPVPVPPVVLSRLSKTARSEPQ